MHDFFRQGGRQGRDGVLRLSQRDPGRRQLVAVLGEHDAELPHLSLFHAGGQGLKGARAHLVVGPVPVLHANGRAGVPSQVVRREGQRRGRGQEHAESARGVTEGLSLARDDGGDDGGGENRLAHDLFSLSRFGGLIASDVLNLAVGAGVSTPDFVFLTDSDSAGLSVPGQPHPREGPLQGVKALVVPCHGFSGVAPARVNVKVHGLSRCAVGSFPGDTVNLQAENWHCKRKTN